MLTKTQYKLVYVDGKCIALRAKPITWNQNPHFVTFLNP